jgi:hypothetical protein
VEAWRVAARAPNRLLRGRDGRCVGSCRATCGDARTRRRGLRPGVVAWGQRRDGAEASGPTNLPTLTAGGDFFWNTCGPPTIAPSSSSPCGALAAAVAGVGL